GLTIVLVTHEADIAAYADRVVTMRDGSIVADERRTPDRLRLPAASGVQVASRSVATPKPALIATGWAFTSMVLAAAAQAIGRNKMRSGLTMLGVFIGVAALIIMMAVGEGANDAVRKQIESLGTNVVVIVPGALTSGGARGGFGS